MTSLLPLLDALLKIEAEATSGLWVVVNDDEGTWILDGTEELDREQVFASQPNARLITTARNTYRPLRLALREQVLILEPMAEHSTGAIGGIAVRLLTAISTHLEPIKKELGL